MLEAIRRDLRLAIRRLRRGPGFALSAIGILGLGIGAASAIFTVVDGVLLRPLPYPRPDRIAWVQETARDGHGMALADPNFLDLRAQSRSFQALAERTGPFPVSVTGGTEPVRATADMISGDFFRVMGVDPVRGRTFLPGEEREGGPPAVVVSWSFWQHTLAGGPIDGRTLSSGGRLYSVVGVMPRGFDYPAGTELWTPAGLEAHGTSRTAHNWRVVGRLADGVTWGQARAELDAIAHRIVRANRGEVDLVGLSAVPLRQALVGAVRTPLLVLLGAAAFLLLIAVSNVGNLLLARMTARRREIAVRKALGAGLGRILGQLLAESTVLGLASGAVGVLLALAGTRALLALSPDYLPRLGGISVDGRVLAFALAVSLATGLGLALVEALGGRSDVRGALAAGQRTVTGGGAGRLVRDGLLVGQTALTLVLLAGAALMARSLLHLLSVPTGFRTDHVLVMNVAAVHPEDPASVRDFEDRLLARLRTLPGVQAAGGISGLPLQDGCADGTYLEMARPDEATTPRGLQKLARLPGRTGTALFCVASRGYFEAMGIPLGRGRVFSGQDAPDADVTSAVVSASFAARRWPNVDPIGKLIQFGNMDGDLRPFRVVGVVGDVREQAMDRQPQPILYALNRQRPARAGLFHVALHTRTDPRALIPAAREALREVDPQVPPTFRTMAQVVGSGTADRRFAFLLLGVFGVTALVLAVSGMYAVVSFLVAQRGRELGVRIAFGARPGDVMRLVVGRGAVLAGIGIGVGIVTSLALTRLLSNLLYGVTSTDPAAYVAGALILAASVLAASWLPARRAGRIDPAATLRAE
jgi:predicted permease